MEIVVAGGVYHEPQLFQLHPLRHSVGGVELDFVAFTRRFRTGGMFVGFEWAEGDNFARELLTPGIELDDAGLIEFQYTDSVATVIIIPMK